MVLSRALVLSALLVSAAHAQTAAPPSAPPPTTGGTAAVTATPAPAANAPARRVARTRAEVDPAAPTPRTARCRVQSVPLQNVAAGQSRSMVIAGDGGWCRTSAWIKDEGPYLDMFVDTPPQHGTVEVHKLATMQAIYYQAAPGYVGPDTMVLRVKPHFSPLTFTIDVRPPPPPRPASASPG